MEIFHAIILGIIEGITEFLPISSTGHLILASKVLSIEQTDFVKSFEIAIQSGAILSVIFLYGRTLFRDFELVKKVLVAFIPTGIIGFILYGFIKTYLLGNANVVLLSLFWGGIALIAIELFLKRKTTNYKLSTTNQVSYKQSMLIGTIQSISMVPGVSRSAATIFGGLFVGLDRKTATEFSFLLAVPTMLAATGLDLKDSSFNFNPNEWTALAVGFITSFIVAIFAIKWLLNYVQNSTFISFGIYRVVIATLYFLLIK